MNAVADNDILYKGSCFRVLDALVGEARAQVGVLGAAQYVLPAKIGRASLAGSPAAAIALLQDFIRDAEVIEPDDDEQALAAALELLAQREGLPFDEGESQLCAVLISREVPHFLTGDKRAIAALERLLDLELRLGPVRGRVRCLEQLVRVLIDRVGLAEVRGAVCAEPGVDRALTNCFSCRSETVPDNSVLEGLASYIADVRRTAIRILAPAP
jgi:hypothetical protein